MFLFFFVPSPFQATPFLYFVVEYFTRPFQQICGRKINEPNPQIWLGLHNLGANKCIQAGRGI